MDAEGRGENMNSQFPDDELVKIWAADAAPVRKTHEEVMALVTKRQKTFEKKIRVRDWREIVAAAIVGMFFLWAAAHSENLLQRVGNGIIVVGSVWIIYYLRTHRFHHIPSDPTLDIRSYTRQLFNEYEKQIRLLKQVKYWYLLPLYLGLMVGWAGSFRRQAQAGLMGPVLSAAFITGLFGAIWWLNEVWAARRVSAERDRMRALLSESDETKER
jgi:hypothetical protein